MIKGNKTQTDDLTNAKVNRFLKIYPWFGGMSGDLLFWIAVDTLFLSMVKGFTSAQIVSLTTYSLVTSIAFQAPALFIMRKIGNDWSIKLGITLSLVSAILLTFGKTYFVIILGRSIFEIGNIFHNMINAVLLNNLSAVGRSDEYLKYRSRSSTMYAVFTMIISFFSGFLFNLNSYLPMYCCITCCIIAVILSFYMTESGTPVKAEAEKKKSLKKIPLSLCVLLILGFFAIYFPTSNSGQSEGKLFIQETLNSTLPNEKVAILISIMLAISRIVRVMSNILLDKIFKAIRTKIIFLFVALLPLSIIIMMFGSRIRSSCILSFIVMTFGYIIILFLRDPVKNLTQWMLLSHSEKKHQQFLLSLMELMRKVVRALINLWFTFLLLENTMDLVMQLLLILSLVGGIIGVVLFFYEKTDSAKLKTTEE